MRLQLLYNKVQIVFLVGERVNDMECIINTELDKINKWIQVNKLSLNLSKTNYMLFKGNKKVASLPNIIMNNVKISCINKSKFLGVIIDDKLTWIHHIEHVSKKISKAIGVISKVKYFANEKILQSLYYAFIQSHINYNLINWSGAYKTNLTSI